MNNLDNNIQRLPNNKTCNRNILELTNMHVQLPMQALFTIKTSCQLISRRLRNKGNSDTFQAKKYPKKLFKEH